MRLAASVGSAPTTVPGGTEVAKQPGRTRWTLARLLRESGLEVDPHDLWVQEGFYRRCDVARWGAFNVRFTGNVTPDGTTYVGTCIVSSWSTMSRCVRHGILVSKAERYGGWNEVSVESKE